MSHHFFMPKKILTLLLALISVLAATTYAQQPPVPATGEKQDCENTNCNEQQSARRPNTPLGARISDALTRQDREAADDILQHERIMLNNEMNLLLLTGRKNEAADIAFTLMERAGQDEALYAQAAPNINGECAGLRCDDHAPRV